MEKGLFITFEGIDGSGKTTQLNKIKSYLEELGYNIAVTREPGAEGIGLKIRDILLNNKDTMSDGCEMFLFLADRAQHADTFIKPSVNKGKIVLCDRYTDSTIAYQGYGRGRDIRLLQELNTVAANGAVPDLTLLYDVSVQTAAERVGNNRDRMEDAGMEFFRKVRNGYLELQKENFCRIKLINANNSAEIVFEETRNIITEFIKKHKEGRC